MLTPPVQPMLLKTTDNKPFNSKKYYFEFKWDGFRCLIFINDNDIYIQSRNKHNLTTSFSELKKITSLLNCEQTVLDGEICYFTSQKTTDFYILQKRLQNKNKKLSKKYPVTFITWDILNINHKNIYTKSLKIRKKILKKTINQENSLLQITPYIKTAGKKLYGIAKEKGFEGIVAKKINSPYEFKRSYNWKKIKIWQYTDAYIGGYSKDFSALLAGNKHKDKLIFRGKIQPSLNSAEKKALANFLPEIKIKKCPFDYNFKNKKYNWVQPAVKCKVRYTELTPDNLFRHGYAVNLLI